MEDEGSYSLEIRDGISSRLRELGYENAEIVCAAPKGEVGLDGISLLMNDGTYDIVFAVGDLSAEAFTFKASETPCFFVAVEEPGDYVEDMKHPDGNVTGIGGLISPSSFIEFSQKLTPDINKFGLVFCKDTSDDINRVCQYLDSVGKDYTVMVYREEIQIETVASTLIDEGAEAVLISDSPIIGEKLHTLAKLCGDRGIPIYSSYSSEKAGNNKGCMAVLGVTPAKIGAAAADMAHQYMSGKDIEDISAVYPEPDHVIIDSAMADSLGVDTSKIDIEIKLAE